MAKGIFYVESRPTGPDRDQEYNAWYDEVHIPELLALDGFVAARRLRPVQDDGPYVSIYDLEGDDLAAIIANMIAAAGRGEFQLSDAMQMDPPPTYRLLELTTERVAVA